MVATISNFPQFPRFLAKGAEVSSWPRIEAMKISVASEA